MNTLREEIEKIIKRDTYAIICSNCSGGGYDYDNQKECEDCNGTGLSEWRLDLPVENILSLIENEKAKQREEIFGEIHKKSYSLNFRPIAGTKDYAIRNAVWERFDSIIHTVKSKYLTQTGEKENK